MVSQSKLAHYLKQFPSEILKYCKKDNTSATIYFFIINEHFTIISRMLLYFIDDYNIVIINNLDNIKNGDIVIPLDEKSQSVFYKSNIYSIFDNKKLFYKYIKTNYMKRCNNYSQIYCINSYDSNYNGKNIFSNFIIKPISGCGSENILYEEGLIYDIIDKFSDNNQIQDVIQIKKTYEVNFVCSNGNVLNKLCCLTEDQSFSTTRYIFGSYGNYINKIPNNILNFCKKIIFDSYYNGFIEFEFIEDKNGKVYIMECNARMSGHIDNPLYFKLLVEPYFNVTSSFVNYIVDEYKYDTIENTLSNTKFTNNYIKYKVNSLNTKKYKDKISTIVNQQLYFIIVLIFCVVLYLYCII